MSIPKELKFAESHEWVKLEGDIATVGISYHAQSELGDIVFVELPEVGDNLDQGDACGNIEAVKTVSDINAPLGGEVVEVNEALEDDSTLINTDCYNEGWIMKIKVSDASELDSLMDAKAYEDFIA